MTMASILSRLRGALVTLLPILALLAAWQAVTAAGLISANLLPSPLAIAGRLITRLQEADFLFNVGQTLIRLGLGFSIALVAGMLLGAAMALGAERWLGPVVRLLAPIPKIALYPALVLLFGYGHASKVALVVADVVFPILYATYHGMRSVQPKWLWSAQAAGAGRGATILGVSLPAAMPSVLTGCRIGLVIACINVFLAEMISSTDGLGHLLMVAARSYQVVDMFVPLVLISLIGLTLAATLQCVRRRLPGGEG
ncbi:ABC transporter permease [Verticiella alkaliphila]|uniref:ABC transporter permease n=1 Tax=Verticiella alkaliphila TaxID=2779529 RepID=UPI001C0E3833|nr:ABC transporter permease subunit [Verticiella sp. GG226]